MTTIRVTLHGVTVEVGAEETAFVDYVRTAFGAFLAEPGTPVDVRSHLRWRDEPPTADLVRSFGPEARWTRRPDRDLYVGDGTAYWLRIDDFPDLHLAARIDGECLHLEGLYHFYLGRGAAEPLRRWRHRARMDQLRARRFSTLLYYLVYHPILWRLSRQRGWCVVHGGAVAAPAGAIALSGMPGCGKSTLAVTALRDPARTMLSDNLILHDGRHVYACPELLLLDDRSRSLAGAAVERLHATGERRVFGRDAHAPDRVCTDPCTPQAWFHVGRSATSACDSVDPDRCADRVLEGNWMAKEVRRIAIMGTVLDAVAGTRAPDERAPLSALLDATPCYELWCGEERGPADVLTDLVEPLLV